MGAPLRGRSEWGGRGFQKQEGSGSVCCPLVEAMDGLVLKQEGL